MKLPPAGRPEQRGERAHRDPTGVQAGCGEKYNVAVFDNKFAFRLWIFMSSAPGGLCSRDAPCEHRQFCFAEGW